MKKLVPASLLLLIVPCLVSAADKTTTGELIIDPPTLMALGFAWPIEGDDNRNARVTVSYRRHGGNDWSQGLDLLRPQNEESHLYGSVGHTGPHMVSGTAL